MSSNPARHDIKLLPQDDSPNSANAHPRDTAWIDGIRSGDEHAFEDLFREFFQRLASFAYGYVKSKDRAAELVHDVLFHLWSNRESWQPATSVGAYLFTAVRNRALKALAHEKVEQQYRDTSATALTPDYSSTSPSSALETAELDAAFNQAVESLPERARQIYLMSREQKLTYKEIAAVLGISENTVDTQIRRALKALREAVEGYL